VASADSHPTPGAEAGREGSGVDLAAMQAKRQKRVAQGTGGPAMAGGGGIGGVVTTVKKGSWHHLALCRLHFKVDNPRCVWLQVGKL